jgi:hypothetical protein
MEIRDRSLCGTSALAMFKAAGEGRAGRGLRDMYPSRVEIVKTWKTVRTGVSIQCFTMRKCRDNIFGLSLID